MEDQGVTTIEKNGAGKAASPAITKRGPVDLFEQLEQEMDAMRRQMMRLFGRPSSEPARPAALTEMAWAPTVDAYERDGAFVVKAELPGVKKDDVHVSFDDGILTIEGERKEEKETKDARYHTRERFSGQFSRCFALPDGIDVGAVTAECKDGTLEVRVPLPKAEKAPPVTIPVKG